MLRNTPQNRCLTSTIHGHIGLYPPASGDDGSVEEMSIVEPSSRSVLVSRDEKPFRQLHLVENGVNIQAEILSRNQLRRSIEGSLQGTMSHSWFALSTLIYTTDESIRELYQNAQTIGSRDRQLRLMLSGSELIYHVAKAEKWLVTRQDLSYSFLWIMYAIKSLAEIERRYRRYRREKTANAWVEEYMKRVMVERTCPDCRGRQLKPQRLLITIGGKHVMELGDLTLSELRDFFAALPPLSRNPQAGAEIIAEIIKRLDLLLDIGIDYLSLNRRATTLSGGESQRVRLSVQIGSELMGMLYVLDEPSIGLHPRDNLKMIDTLKRLRDIGNTVIVVEHDETTMRAADHIIEIGPGPGNHGGQVVAQGCIESILEEPASLTGDYLTGRREIPEPNQRRAPTAQALVIRGASENNLKQIDVTIPLDLFVCITGVSGSGKSTLINEILHKQLQVSLRGSRVLPGSHERIDGIKQIHDIIDIDQTPIGRTPTSNPATYVGIFDAIRKLFVKVEASQQRGYTLGRFSFNTKGGRCEECRGQGLITTSLQFMADVEVICHACKGARYNEETLEVEYNGKTIAQVLDMPLEEAVCFFKAVPLVAHKMGVLNQLGLGYLKLGQSSTTISGGEAQRIKLANELGKIKRGGRILYILDEPTTGLHLADIQRLLDALNQLVDAGNSVVVIEHHLDVIKNADWVIDLGPEGGKEGGYVVVQGTPAEVAACERSYTGHYLRAM